MNEERRTFDLPEDISRSLIKNPLRIKILFLLIGLFYIVGLIVFDTVFGIPQSHSRVPYYKENPAAFGLVAVIMFGSIWLLRMLFMRIPAKYISKTVNDEMRYGKDFEKSLYDMIMKTMWSRHRLAYKHESRIERKRGLKLELDYDTIKVDFNDDMSTITIRTPC